MKPGEIWQWAGVYTYLVLRQEERRTVLFGLDGDFVGQLSWTVRSEAVVDVDHQGDSSWKRIG